jgi:hypothetical protein
MTLTRFIDLEFEIGLKTRLTELMATRWMSQKLNDWVIFIANIAEFLYSTIKHLLYG